MKQEKNLQVPKSLISIFWDVEFSNLRTKTHEFLIIKRVLDRGNLDGLRWLFKTYGETAIKTVILETKDLARPTGNFWADVLNLPKNEVPCLQKPYFPIHFGLFS